MRIEKTMSEEFQEYHKSVLESGYCPLCKLLLEKIEWYKGDEVIYHSVYDSATGKYEIHESETEITLSELDPIIEYRCDHCELSFHVDNDSFIAD